MQVFTPGEIHFIYSNPCDETPSSTLCLFYSIDRFAAILGQCSEFGVVSTMKGPNHINHKAILHKNCHLVPLLFTQLQILSSAREELEIDLLIFQSSICYLLVITYFKNTTCVHVRLLRRLTQATNGMLYYILNYSQVNLCLSSLDISSNDEVLKDLFARLAANLRVCVDKLLWSYPLLLHYLITFVAGAEDELIYVACIHRVAGKHG